MASIKVGFCDYLNYLSLLFVPVFDFQPQIEVNQVLDTQQWMVTQVALYLQLLELIKFLLPIEVFDRLLSLEIK